MSSALAQELRSYVHHHRQPFLSLLEELTLLETPSRTPTAQQPLLRRLNSEFDALEFNTRLLPGRTSGGTLYARPQLRKRFAPCQLLLGHGDTVWPAGTLAQMPFEVDGNIARGPGVFDMKAGLVQILFALKALQACGAELPVTPVVLVNSDEEIGSRDSTALIRRLAPRMCRAFVTEPALGPEGRLKTARKGVGRFTITIHGKAAHAGLDPTAGASAILELSYVVQQLFALNDFDKGTTVNVGTVDGGVTANVVAPISQAVVDVRAQSNVEAEKVATAIHALKPTIPGVRLEIDGAIGRPVMESNPANRLLWQLALQQGQALGLELQQVFAGGGSDGNTTSQFCATLDGLGAVGDGAHARHEMIYIEQTLDRTALLALLLAAPAHRSQP